MTRCLARQGSYRLARLAAAYGPETPLEEVLASIKSSVSYADGGYTGPGGHYDVAGFVHRGEVVFSAADVARHGGVGAVDALRRSGGLRGYADGGIVGRDAITMPWSAPAGMFGGAPQVVFTPNIITPTGYDARTREVPDGLGGRRPEVTSKNSWPEASGASAASRHSASGGSPSDEG